MSVSQDAPIHMHTHTRRLQRTDQTGSVSTRERNVAIHHKGTRMHNRQLSAYAFRASKEHLDVRQCDAASRRHSARIGFRHLQNETRQSVRNTPEHATRPVSRWRGAKGWTLLKRISANEREREESCPCFVSAASSAITKR